VRPLHDLDALAGLCGKAGRVARDDADRLAAAEDVAEDLVADLAGGVVMTIMRASNDEATWPGPMRHRVVPGW